MNKTLTLCCVAAGLIGATATGAQAAQPVDALPSIAHVNETVVVFHRHHRRGHWVYRHHRRGHWVYRHHHRVWVRY